MIESAAAQSLTISGLLKRYGTNPVLRGLDLGVAANAIHGLVGLNGSGKTTTLECVLGMQGHDGGSVSVLGYRPRDLHRARGRVVGVFDTPSLHPNLTVRQNLEHARQLCAHPVRSAADVEAMLDIEGYRDYRLRHLSLGNRRRASIAQALLGNPELILLDEPFNGLDAGGVDHVLELVRTLNREQGTAFLLSSHQLPYLEQICTHLAILHQGTIPLSGPLPQLFAGLQTRLRIRCDQPARAARLLQDAGLGVFLEQSSSGTLEGELARAEAWAINHHLVDAGIAVHELVPERATLAGLFNSVINRAAA